MYRKIMVAFARLAENRIARGRASHAGFPARDPPGVCRARPIPLPAGGRIRSPEPALAGSLADGE